MVDVGGGDLDPVGTVTLRAEAAVRSVNSCRIRVDEVVLESPGGTDDYDE